MLHGREHELRRLEGLLDDARAGRGGALVVLGEPGVGKSALLAAVADSAGGFRVLRASGLESEAPLAFAALHRLLRPVQHLLEGLPAPQASAMRVAFGLDSGATAEAFLVALATLTLLSDAGAATPVLCVVDDAHWLDTASRDALLFAARRLTDEHVAVVVTARTPTGPAFDAPGVDTLVLDGLDGAAASAVLAERGAAPLPPSVVAALIARTGGNPLGLVELPSTLTAGQLAGTEPLPERLALTRAVERSFLDRVRRLSPSGQTALLVASADDSGQLRVVREAVAECGDGADGLTEAEVAGLLLTDGDAVQVAHPLVRSATYQAATGSERRAAHRALAAALTGGGNADRRAWHVAAAVDGPDLEAAGALTGVAVHAERRGGYDAAAAAFTRAAELTEDAERRARLLFHAARNEWLAGHADAAARALRTARPLTASPVLQADVDRLRGRLEVNVGSAAVAQRIFLDAARAVAAADPERALEMAVAAVLLRTFDPDAGHDPTLPALDLPAPAAADGPRLRTLRLMFSAQAAEADGRLADAQQALAAGVLSHRSTPAEHRPDDPDAWTTCAGSEPDLAANLGNIAMALGQDELAADCYTRVLADGRHTGAVTVVLYALPRLAFPQLLLGRWDDLRRGAHEAADLATSIRSPALAAGPLAWLALLAALQGDPAHDELRRRAAAAGEEHLGVFTQLFRDLQRWAGATVAGNAGDARAAMHELGEMRVPALRRMTALPRITAAVRAGETALARRDLDELAAFTDASRLPWALAATEHARAEVGPAGTALEHLERALEHHEGSGRTIERACTQLALGEHLRRAQRRTDARTHLRAALVTFEDVSAEPLAARARSELRASGETARKRDPSTRVALTPMEAQVASLVAQGLSNKDVATQLWISPRTVAFHLRGVFAKHGITSRGELSRLGL